MVTTEHRKRIIAELKAAGMTSYGTVKMETNKLPSYIHQDEHIGGVVYGRTTGQKVGSAMLVATDKRIIFLDVKPFFVTFDEVSYDVVSGVKKSSAGPFASVTLHTRVRDYGLRYVNKLCAEKFVHFIETHIELHNSDDLKNVPNEVWKSTIREQKLVAPDHNAMGLIGSQNIATLSTVDNEGNVHGAVIHYLYLDEQFYFVTKSETTKARHIALHNQVALTIHEQNSLQTVQISGIAEKERSTEIISEVFKSISTPKNYAEGNHFAPIVSMKKGDYVVFRVSPTTIKYHDFSKTSW
jgi:general stress protein 26